MAKKIMVVDDDPTTATVVKAVLTIHGFDVITASSGRECLDKVKDIKPDLILLDIMMPSMDGWETLRKLKEDKITDTLSVAMLTVKEDIGEAPELRDVVSDYITKPFSKADLIERVKKLMA
ncbi:MAG: response regulator [Candidatus Altiarchaeales archaeon]|nr:response regulator [Candidatus Altiarchaeota archaeon]MBU4341235.1 response regulator [Candidatus Altiarchaeota archaeon]MCG2782501.1 response regulator [Candidatus Altiarchaeales archaeon]